MASNGTTLLATLGQCCQICKFYVNSILVHLEPSTIAILSIFAWLNFDFDENQHLFQCWDSPKSYCKVSKSFERTRSAILNFSKLISRKIRKCEIHTLLRQIHIFFFSIYRSVIVCEDSDQLIALVQQQNGVDVTNTVKKGEDSRLVDPDAVLATEVNSEKRPKFLCPLGKKFVISFFFSGCLWPRTSPIGRPTPTTKTHFRVRRWPTPTPTCSQTQQRIFLQIPVPFLVYFQMLLTYYLIQSIFLKKTYFFAD